VQLGRLGDAILRRQGVEWQALPRVDAAPEECLFFPETGHSICPPFRSAWERSGGMAILGLPLSQPLDLNRPGSGESYMAQYFERARLEHVPEYAGTPQEVQLGLLGREWLAPQ